MSETQKSFVQIASSHLTLDDLQSIVSRAEEARVIETQAEEARLEAERLKTERAEAERLETARREAERLEAANREAARRLEEARRVERQVKMPTESPFGFKVQTPSDSSPEPVSEPAAPTLTIPIVRDLVKEQVQPVRTQIIQTPMAPRLQEIQLAQETQPTQQILPAQPAPTETEVLPTQPAPTETQVEASSDSDADVANRLMRNEPKVTEPVPFVDTRTVYEKVADFNTTSSTIETVADLSENPARWLPEIDRKDREPTPQPDETVEAADTNEIEQQVEEVEAELAVRSEPVEAAEDEAAIVSSLKSELGQVRIKDPNTTRFVGDAYPPEVLSQASDLVQQILTDFPRSERAVILIADARPGSGSESVAAKTALELASLEIGNIVLIDSHLESREISVEMGCGGQNGLADVLTLDYTLENVTCGTDAANLDFIPVGSPMMCRRRLYNSPKFANAVQTIKTNYEFAIVAVGSAFDHGAALWGQRCDGTYLMIASQDSSQFVARTGVKRLQQQGARLKGCVITDAA